MAVTAGVLSLIGRTPLVRLNAASEATGCEILGKAEFMNPGGFQMNYWPSEVTNLSETHIPLIDWVEIFKVAGAATAQEHWNARGWSVSHVSNIWNASAPYSNQYMYWSYYPVTGAWLCQHVWDHFTFTQDTTYLRERAYSIMKSQAEFLEDYLYELPDSSLASTPSWSAEHGPISIGAAGDHAVSWDLLNNIAEASEILGIDSLGREIWKNMRDRIVPPKIGSWGQLQEWYEDIDDPDEQHRHTNHLLGLAPGRQISPLTTPELAEAARVALLARGNGSGSGWNMGQLTLEYARLFDGETAYEKVGFQLENNTRLNFFSAKNVFQVDGNFGFTAGIAEMLLQSHMGMIHFLPALPQAWAKGQVTGLVARGGFEVDITWDQGELTAAKIQSNAGGLCKLLYNGNTVEFETVAGGIYNITFENDEFIVPINKGSCGSSLSASISPNPTSGKFQVITAGGPEQKVMLEIYNIAGIKMRTNALNDVTALDISNYPEGAYYALIRYEHGIVIRKKIVLMKQ